jgi:hypothetical protein
LFLGAILFLVSIPRIVAQSADTVELVEETDEFEEVEHEDHAADATATAEGGEVQKTDPVDEDKVYVTEAVGMAATFVFHKPGGYNVIAGETVELLVGLENYGQDSYNVTHIYAALLHPEHRYLHVENYTAIGYSDLVRPGEHRTFSYFFTPSQYLQARDDFGLLSVAFMNKPGEENSRRIYRAVIMNTTIALTEPSSVFDADMLFLYAGAIAIVVLVLFLAFKAIAKKTKARGYKKAIETGTRGMDESSEWLEGTNVHVGGTRQRARK